MVTAVASFDVIIITVHVALATVCVLGIRSRF